MSLSRRDFLKTSSLVALGSAAPAFLQRAVGAAQTADRPGARDTILVVLQLTGGNDGLNTVVPHRNEVYTRQRTSLRIPSNEVLRVSDELGLHPSMTGMARLLEDRALCIVQGVGYPNPDQSHFRSMDIWHAASMAESLTEGWVGKSLRGIPGATSFHLASANEPAPLALTGAPVRVPSITSLADFQLRVQGLNAADTRRQRSLIEASASGPAAASGPGLLDFVRHTANNTYASSRRLQEVSRTYVPSVPYPNTPTANHLKLAAQLIDVGAGTRLFYVTLDGFDTHAAQKEAHANLLKEVSDAVTAFYRDMAARGQAERLLIMTFSEFGRRVRENGSSGTDHGSAAPMFLVGGRVRPGLVGAHPSLTDLDAGNLRHHTDFRQVYAAVLEHWLGIPSRPVLGQAYAPVDVLRR